MRHYQGRPHDDDKYDRERVKNSKRIVIKVGTAVVHFSLARAYALASVSSLFQACPTMTIFIDTRKLHGWSRQQGGGRRRLQDPSRGDHLRRGPPIPGGPVESREQAAENDSTPRQGRRSSGDAGGDTSTNNIHRGNTPMNKICRGAPRATHEQHRLTNEMV